ncbi:MAG TPA: hypothetical protein VI391_01315, partial [Thermoanaerobaculia bacterium]
MRGSGDRVSSARALGDRVAVAIIAALWLVSTLLWLRPGITRPDGVGYFAYLPSTYFDHDLVLFNEWQHFGMMSPDGVIASEGISPNGHLADHWTAGSAVVWYPAFVAANLLLPSFPRNGISLPYNVAAISASAICGLATLLVGFIIARRFFTSPVALIATIATWFGSSLMWYSTREALMSHAVGAAICALVVLASIENQALAAGIAAGLAFAVRPQNATFILVPLILIGIRKWLPVAGGFVIGALPQIVVAIVLYGNPLSLYNVVQGPGGHAWYGWKAFERVWPWQPVFSWYHGLATWTPLMIIGAAGLLLLFRSHVRLASAALLMFGLQWAINSSVDRFFWGGSSFGQRRFDNCTVFFLIGLAALFDVIPRWLAIAIAAAGSLWTMALFFAPINLNRYYAPDELLGAVAHPKIHVDLFESAPSNFKLDVLIVFGAIVVLYALIAAAVRARPDVVAGTFCVVIAAWFAICGFNDRAHLEAWSSVIAKNQSGALRDRLALMGDEEDYLRRSGNTAEAQRTANEINE